MQVNLVWRPATSPASSSPEYAKAARRLNEEAQRDPEFMRISDYGGGNQS